MPACSHRYTKSVIAEEIIDNLISFHSTTNPDGFGTLDSTAYCDDWRTYYQPIAVMIHEKAKQLWQSGKLSDNVLNTMGTALEHFYDIFYLPIKDACCLQS